MEETNEIEIIDKMCESLIGERGKTYSNFLEASQKEFGANIMAKYLRFERNDISKLLKGENDINPDTVLDLINYFKYTLVKTGAHKRHYHYKKVTEKREE